MPNEIIIDSPEEAKLRAELAARTDAEALRMRRFLDMPDLSRTEGSPLHEIVSRALAVESLKGLDVIKIPEIISTHILFDLFNMPPGHPARSASDTYYVNPVRSLARAEGASPKDLGGATSNGVNDDFVLRTHDTVFWYYYLNHPAVKEKIAQKEPIGAVCYGKVYRKDEIDRRHMNVFHQFGGLYLVPDDKGALSPDDLKRALSEVAESIFGKDVQFRFYDHQFPYTDPSLEMEAFINGQWVEMVGSGMARKSVLLNFGLAGYHGWAFGFGLERLAIASMSLPDIRLLWSTDPRVTRQLALGTTYKEVSKYPPITRDISFVVPKAFVPNNYFDLIREIGGELVEEVSLLDKYENDKKFGADKMSYTYRIIYRSNERTLTIDEIEPLQNRVIEETKKQFNAEIR